MILVDFVKKILNLKKIRDHCHLTRKNRGPAHSKLNIIDKQSQSIFFSVTLHNFSNYGCHLFFKKLADKKKDKV